MAEYFVNGVIPSIGKRIAIYTFTDKFDKFEHRKDLQEYHIFIKGEVHPNIITHFKKHWPGFKVFISKSEEA